MLNQENFTNRLHQLFKHYGLSAASFADEIKVQRSSISHLLSGRNKPSLEFVLKIVSTYNEVTLNWLLYGKGNFPEKKQETSTIHSVNQNTTPPLPFSTSQEIEKIVIFYKNGKFKEYLSE